MDLDTDLLGAFDLKEAQRRPVVGQQEMRGILHPTDVASRAAALLDQPAKLDAMSDALSRIYAKDVGASGRMADEVLALASGQAALPTAL